MKEIIILTDYKGFFGSNYDSKPYRSGFNKEILSDLFKQKGFAVGFLNFSDVENIEHWKDKIVLYTSNEEPDYKYKSFIEDIIQYLNIQGAILIPKYELLRANNNKSFMELYKNHLLKEKDLLKSMVFGSLEEVRSRANEFEFPLVFKTSEGAMSSGVALVRNKIELFQQIKKSNRTASFKRKLKEYYRKIKHAGYQMDSFYQKKFILQPFVPNLQNDWKVLIFDEQVYILKRGIRKNDFRASGSHVGYKAGIEAGFPLHKLDELMEFKHEIGIPHLSVDYTYDGQKGYIIEFQGIYFGLSTLNYCNEYFLKVNGEWVTKPNTMSKEELYVYSIVKFLKTEDESSLDS